MVYMRDGYMWQAHSGQRRGQWKMESVGCYPFTWSPECNCRKPKRGTQEGGNASSETVPNQPDVSVWKERSQVVDKSLNARRSEACPEKWLDGTYDAGGIK